MFTFLMFFFITKNHLNCISSKTELLNSLKQLNMFSSVTILLVLFCTLRHCEDFSVVQDCPLLQGEIDCLTAVLRNCCCYSKQALCSGFA